MAKRGDSRELTLRAPAQKGIRWKMAPAEFDIRMPRPRPMGPLFDARILIKQEGPGEIRVELGADDPIRPSARFFRQNRVGV